VPTGVALRDAREQLFEAAERVLVQEGPSALTSRAVTSEAGVAKGVLHRHFADLDEFLTELVLDRLHRLDAAGAGLADAPGAGTVADNLTSALMALFGPVSVAIIALVISRDGLRARLRQAGTARVPLLGEGTAMIASYLTAERELGRIATDADVDALAPTLVGAVHLVYTDREGDPPGREAVHRIVDTIVSGAVKARRQ
jgi:AcrR family transcriptional regulator